jgi:hypothetical protein
MTELSANWWTLLNNSLDRSKSGLSFCKDDITTGATVTPLKAVEVGGQINFGQADDTARNLGTIRAYASVLGKECSELID